MYIHTSHSRAHPELDRLAKSFISLVICDIDNERLSYKLLADIRSTNLACPPPPLRFNRPGTGYISSTIWLTAVGKVASKLSWLILVVHLVNSQARLR